MEKYNEKFTVSGDYWKLSSWTHIAKKQIERWIDDEEFSDYISREILKNDENPPGPFTRFLYWFGSCCEAGWGTMIDFNEYRQRVHLVDKYYKWMHKLRDEIYEARELQAGGVVLKNVAQTELQSTEPRALVIPVGYLRSCPCRYFKLSTNVYGQFCKYLVRRSCFHYT